MSKRTHTNNSKTSFEANLPGPENITRTQLPNGLTILCRANYNSPSVFISGYLPVGALFDPDEQLGLAGFTACMLMRGTEHRDFTHINNTLESVGATLGLSSGTHLTSFSGMALSEDLEMLLSLLAEVLQQPIFPGDQVERLRAQLLTALSIRNNTTSSMAALSFDKIIYNCHPYSRPEDGYPETIKNISQSDLKEFYLRYYGPSGMLVTIVGAVDPRKSIEKVTEFFENWKNLEQPKSPKLPSLAILNNAITKHTSIPGKSHSDIIIGVAGPPRNDPSYLAAALGNSVLGKFGMMGRLGETVREKLGLAYYIESTITGGIGPGPWYVSASVDPENINLVIELINQEVLRFISEPITSEELTDNQSKFIGQLPLSMESNAGVALALNHLERYQLGPDYYQHYPQLIESITAEDVLEVASNYLNPHRFGISIAGP